MTETPWTLALARLGLEDPFSPGQTTPHMRRALKRAAPYLDIPGPDLASVEDLLLPGAEDARPARLYTPPGVADRGPCLIFMHGGGYLIGDLDTHDRLCRMLAGWSGVRVLALDYRLAPEHPFPAGVEDVLAIFDALVSGAVEVRGVDPDQLAVGGDSAGGGLTAMLAQQRREQIRFQLLIYPLLQIVQTRKPKLKALEGHFLSVMALDQIVDAYLARPEQASDLRASPLMENDLKGLPPAFTLAAELDPLLDEGQAYHQRLLAAGVPATYLLGQALPHGYATFTAIFPPARHLVRQAADALASAFRTTGLPAQG